MRALHGEVLSPMLSMTHTGCKTYMSGLKQVFASSTEMALGKEPTGKKRQKI